MNAGVTNLLRLAAWLAVFTATAWVGWSADSRRKAAHGEPRYLFQSHDLGLADGRKQTLDLYLPRSSNPGGETTPAPRPVLLAVHGGSWMGGTRSDYGRQMSRFTELGYVVCAVDYPLARPGSPGWPSALEALRQAVRWIRGRAEELQIDPDHVAAIGSGAGGHLAALLGAPPDSSVPADGSRSPTSAQVNAVVSLYGPIDLAALAAQRRLDHDPALVFMGGLPADQPNAWKAASPLGRVGPGFSPMMLIHGSDDRWVSPNQAERMASALTEASILNRLRTVPGARHGFELIVLDSQPPLDLLPEIDQFLRDAFKSSRSTQ